MSTSLTEPTIIGGEMAILDRTGHSRQIWDPRNPDEVEAARATFNKLKGKGYIAYKVKPDGSEGEIMTTFDPQAEKMIMAPPVVGG
jgi:hypothetical protein